MIQQHLARSRDRWLWCLAFVASFLLYHPAIFPYLYQINVMDVPQYIFRGRMLMNGISEGHAYLTEYAANPMVSFLYALVYVPFHNHVYWLVLTEWGARLVLFCSIWVSWYLLARKLRELTHPLVMASFLVLLPIIPAALSDPTTALWLVLACLAFGEMVAFLQRRRLRRLAVGSLLLGLAALTRNDGLVVFPIFVVLGLTIWLSNRRPRQQIARGALLGGLAAALPYLVVVFGYIVVYWRLTDSFGLATPERTYIAFEQAEGVVYSREPEAFVTGIDDARRLYGTPEENDRSVLRAIQRNPAAFGRRVERMLQDFGPRLAEAYGGTLGWVWLLLVAFGIGALLRRRQYLLLLLCLAWPSHWIVYLIKNHDSRYFILAAFAGCLLAAVGATSAWSVVWDRVRRTSGVREVRWAQAAGLAAMLALLLVLHGPFPSPQLPQLGSSGEEQAAAFLESYFPRGTLVGSYAPPVVWMAKMEWEPMFLELHDADGDGQIDEWLARHHVRAIYLDPFLKRLEPRTYAAFERRIGRGFDEVFTPRELGPAPREAVAALKPGHADQLYRILVVESLPMSLVQQPGG